jgi:hypothetical protein
MLTYADVCGHIRQARIRLSVRFFMPPGAEAGGEESGGVGARGGGGIALDVLSALSPPNLLHLPLADSLVDDCDDFTLASRDPDESAKSLCQAPANPKPAIDPRTCMQALPQPHTPLADSGEQAHTPLHTLHTAPYALQRSSTMPAAHAKAHPTPMPAHAGELDAQHAAPAAWGGGGSAQPSASAGGGGLQRVQLQRGNSISVSGMSDSGWGAPLAQPRAASRGVPLASNAAGECK